MGGGRWDTVTANLYSSRTSERSSRGIDSFAYTQQAVRTQQVHPSLDPKRINLKPFKKLESRDSLEHPESNAVLVSFDVTGSNVSRAREAQLKLPKLMDMLVQYLPDPQVAFAANDDFEVEAALCAQISDFESDIRIDDHLRNIALVGDGGGNQVESYDLILYAAARKTILDCWEKRKRKGYLFMYADEPFRETVSRSQIKYVFGDELAERVPTKKLIEEARKQYHVFLISTILPLHGAKEQYEKLFGKQSVLPLQDPSTICELIASAVGLTEYRDRDVVADLVAAGADKKDAAAVYGTIKRVFLDDVPA